MVKGGKGMSLRHVSLSGGPPWGFRLTGALADGTHVLKISRVNPGSKAAEKVREGDLISSINGKEADNLTNQEAQVLLNSDSDTLQLVLCNKRSEDLKKKRSVTPEKLLDNDPSSDSTSDRKPPAPILVVRAEAARLPLPASPEYIALKQSRERKRSESLSSLKENILENDASPPGPGGMSMSVSSEDDMSSSTSDSNSAGSGSGGRQERQAAWLRSIKQTKSTKTKMRIIKSMLERDYDSEPELDLDLQMEEYLKFANSTSHTADKQRHNIGTAFQTNHVHKTIKKGKIENYQSDVEEISRSNTPEIVRPDSSSSNNSKYLHEILASGDNGDQVLKVKKARKQVSSEAEQRKSSSDLAGVYRNVQSGGEIPSTGLRVVGKKGRDRVEFKTDYNEEKINIHFKTTIRSEVKENIPEEVLDKMLEEKMRKVYAEMDRKKRERLEQDYESRKHNDNFLPKDKKDIVITNYKEAKKNGTKRSLFGFKAKALYDFVAESGKELSFQRGNILTVTGDVDDNWLKGELGGRSGIFPGSYVEFILNRSEEKLKVIAKYNFKAKNPIELTMLKGEILEVERNVDHNWVEVSLGERLGIVPMDYLEVLNDDGNSVTEGSWGSTPSTPERPSLAGVLTERLYRPTDLLKSKLREEFAERERKMENVDNFISETIEQFCAPPVGAGAENVNQEEAPRLRTIGGNENSSGLNNGANGLTLTSPGDNYINNGKYFLHVVVEEYRPQVDAELPLCVGDRVCVLQDFHDGWMAGVEKCSGHLGLFPARCVTSNQK